MGAKPVSLPKGKAEKNVASQRKNTPQQSVPRPSVPSTSSESFPDKFFYSLSKLSENSNNREFGRKHKARGGETLDDLLLRVYGPQARRIPKSITENIIRSLNPGADFSSLAEGEMVLLPVVK